MKVLAAVLCLSLLIAVAFAQTGMPGNALVQSCSEICSGTCDFLQNIGSLFKVFLGPFLKTTDSLCRQTCGVLCGFFG